MARDIKVILERRGYIQIFSLSRITPYSKSPGIVIGTSSLTQPAEDGVMTRDIFL
jgi:hypothetical protein